MRLIFLLFIASLSSYNIVNHIAGNGLGLKDTRSDENTIVLTLHGSLASLDRVEFFANLSRVIEQDHCSLSFSGDCDLLIILTIYCEKLNNTVRMTLAERAKLPSLQHTLNYAKEKGFQLDNVEYLKIVTKPTYWYGTAGNMDAILRRYFDNLNHKQQQQPEPHDNVTVHGRFVEYPAPWGLDRIDMRYGLLDSEYNYNVLGENVDVYVIDTGIRLSHTEFEGRAQALINTAGDGVAGDCNGHGTHVASLVGGRLYGAAKGVSLWAVKVLDCTGSGDTFTVVTGIMAAIEHANTRGRRAVASMSLGGDLSVTINNAVLALLNNGINAVVAAGNEYDNACDYTPSILGGSSHVITVGASTIQDTRPAWSNYGSCVSITAPGAEIIGAFHTSDTATKVLSGTSMATPFVSGVAALILNQNPALSVAEVKSLLTSWATPAIVTGTSVDGGGKNLLYSLVIPTTATPAPTTTPGLPPVRRTPQPTFSAAHPSTQLSLLLSFTLFIVFLLS